MRKKAGRVIPSNMLDIHKIVRQKKLMRGIGSLNTVVTTPEVDRNRRQVVQCISNYPYHLLQIKSSIPLKPMYREATFYWNKDHSQLSVDLHSEIAPDMDLGIKISERESQLSLRCNSCPLERKDSEPCIYLTSEKDFDKNTLCEMKGGVLFMLADLFEAIDPDVARKIAGKVFFERGIGLEYRPNPFIERGLWFEYRPNKSELRKKLETGRIITILI